MGLHFFCGILWEVLQKVSIFFYIQKMPFWTINLFNLQREIPKNYPDCGKILLKIILACFGLIKLSNKFCGVLIVKSIKIDKILQNRQN